MKAALISIITALALVVSAQAADTTAKISNVHICCNSCVKGINTAVATVPGASAVADMDEGTVKITGPDVATVQKAADALVAAGYFGTSSDVKLDATTGAKDQKVQTMTVSGVHLCCGKCVKSVNEAVKTVPGVQATTAKKGATSFDVTGDFNEKDVMAALQKDGLTGKTGM
jgi:copper chaperone CopZ